MNHTGSVAVNLAVTGAALVIWKRTNLSSVSDWSVAQVVSLSSFTVRNDYGDTAISADGKTIVASMRYNGTVSDTARFVVLESNDLNTWSMTANVVVPTSQIYGIAISADGSTIAITQSAGTVLIYKKG
jgi:uncharacterized membrane protein